MTTANPELVAFPDPLAPGGITLIVGTSGIGKTPAALNFAQEPGSVFLAGDEDEIVLRRKAAGLGLNVANTTFINNTIKNIDKMNDMSEVLEQIERLLLIPTVKRVVVDDFNRLRGSPASVWAPQLQKLIAASGAHLLATVNTRLTGSETKKLTVKFAGAEVPLTLSYIATNVILLDSPFNTRPTGALVKARTLRPHQVPDELFGVKLRCSF